MTDPKEDQVTNRRAGESRRGFFRGGRRESDWPDTLRVTLSCPRCGSTEAKFVEGTPATLFWKCHTCRHAWSTTQEGRVIEHE